MTGQDRLGVRRGCGAENRSDSGRVIGLPDGGVADLEKLAAEVNGGDYEARLVAPQGRRPHLYVRNRRAGVLKENIYCGDGFYWFGWAEPIAPVADVAEAARIVTRVLRAVDAGR
jgi:hypothetical protein